MLKSNNFIFGNQIIVFILFTNSNSHSPNSRMMFCARDHNFRFHINADHDMLLARNHRRFGKVSLDELNFLLQM